MNDQFSSEPFADSGTTAADVGSSQGLKGQATERFHEGREQAKQLGSMAKERALGLADSKKGAVSSQLSSVADSLDTVCRELQGKGVPAEKLLGGASQWVRSLSSDIETK